EGQRPADLGVVGVAGELVAEDDGLHLDPVHQDDPGPGVGVHVALVERLDVEVVPAPELLLDREALLLERVHRAPPVCSGWPDRTATASASSSFVICERPSMPSAWASW